MDILSSIASMTTEMSVARFAMAYSAEASISDTADLREAFEYASVPSYPLSAATLSPPQFIDTYA